MNTNEVVFDSETVFREANDIAREDEYLCNKQFFEMFALHNDEDDEPTYERYNRLAKALHDPLPNVREITRAAIGELEKRIKNQVCMVKKTVGSRVEIHPVNVFLVWCDQSDWQDKYKLSPDDEPTGTLSVHLFPAYPLMEAKLTQLLMDYVWRPAIEERGDMKHDVQVVNTPEDILVVTKHKGRVRSYHIRRVKDIDVLHEEAAQQFPSFDKYRDSQEAVCDYVDAVARDKTEQWKVFLDKHTEIAKL